MRQLVTAGIGIALLLALIVRLPDPLWLRLLAAAPAAALLAVMVWWRPGGRSCEEWALLLLRYGSRPRIAVWRRRGRALPALPALREVVLTTDRRVRGQRDAA